MRCLSGLCSKASNEVLHMGNFALLLLVGALLVGQLLGSDLLKGAVVAFEQSRLLVLNVQGLSGELIQKVPIMRD